MTPGNTYTDLLTFAFESNVPHDDQRPLYIDAEKPTHALNASQFKAIVKSFIAGLRAVGVERGDCVLIHMGNSFIYSALFFSIIGAEGIYAGCNPTSKPYELDHIIGLVEPKLIITSDEALPALLDALADQRNCQARIGVLEQSSIAMLLQPTLWNQHPRRSKPLGLLNSKISEARCFTLADLLSYGEQSWIGFDDKRTSQNTPAALFFTSGTSGPSKAAMLSHYAMISQHQSIQYDVPYEVTRLISVPFFHLFGSLWAHIFPIRYGQPLYILKRFDLMLFIETIHRERITETYLVPPMVHALNRCSVVDVSQLLTSLRYIGIAGAPIDEQSMQQCQSHLHSEAQVSQIWGMTEVGVAFQVRYGKPDSTGSIGRLTPAYQPMIINDEKRIILRDNEPGELFLRGPGLFGGYRGGSLAHKQDEWFATGDIVYTKNGKYYLVGRSKELIKVKGWQVAPAELETLLLKHPLILDAAVVGVITDNHYSEVPRAFIVPKEGYTDAITADEVFSFARNRLSTYKALDGGIVFVKEIPRTPSGKIQRFKLLQMNNSS